MLIRSPRHTAEDLRVWRELESADILHAPAIQEKIRQSLSALGDFVAAGKCYAGVSWGKDSVVLAHLLREVDRTVPLIHLRPTNHNPDSDSVRDIYFSAFPGQPYEEVVVDYASVDRSGADEWIDRETDRLWYAAIRAVERRFDGRHILGIRADESLGRKRRFQRWGLTSPKTCAPLGYWRVEDIFAYLAVMELPAHPAYGCLGGGRWKRDRIRVAEIGDTHGRGGGRLEWEREYYPDVLRRNLAGRF